RSLTSSPSARRLSLHCFPTRRSSDLPVRGRRAGGRGGGGRGCADGRAATSLAGMRRTPGLLPALHGGPPWLAAADRALAPALQRSEEHTSELQSRENLVCRLLLEKKK